MLKNVLICDDHAFCRMGVEVTLKTIFPEVKIREARSAEEAILLIEKSKPDLMFLDINLPKMSGLDLARELKHKIPQLPIIIITSSDHPETFRQLQKIGVFGVIRKGSETEELKLILEKLNFKVNEETFFDSSIKFILKKDEMMTLTSREYEVLEFIVQGLPNREIAEKLGCALTTIRTHRASIMQKTNIRNAAELTAWFLQGQRKSDESSLSKS